MKKKTSPSVATSSPSAGLKRAKPAPLSLEPRLVFDADTAKPVDAFAALPAATERIAAPAPEKLAVDTRSVELPESRASLPALPAEVPAPAVREVVFIDTAVADWQTLAAQVKPSAHVALLGRDGDALEQIRATLASFRDLDSVHILSHGSEGNLILGGKGYDAAGLAARSDTLADIGRSLSADGDILLYGCDIAKGSAGVSLVAQLARSTGADVAASVDGTGSSAMGADWTLEMVSGSVETPSILSASPDAYAHRLNTLALNTNTGWTAVMYGASKDPQGDSQAGAADTDIIGDASHGSLYLAFDDNGTVGTADDTALFRMRIDNPTSDNVFGGVAVVGMDANGDGKVDIFMTVDGRNNTQAVQLMDPGTGANNSPSTTTTSPIPSGWIVGDGSYAFTAANYSVNAVSSSTDSHWNSDNDLGNDGKIDTFVSWRIPFADIAAVLAQPSPQNRGGDYGPRGATGLPGFTKDTVVRFVNFTQTQPGPINGDMSGVPRQYDSGATFEQLGIFTAPMSFANLVSAVPNVDIVNIAGDRIINSSEVSNVTISGTSGNLLNQPLTLTITDGTRTVTASTTTDPVTGAWTVTGVNLSSFNQGSISVTASAPGATDVDAAVIDTRAPSVGTGATDLNVTAITTDSGTSGDFRTNDNTLVISGTFNAADTATLTVAFNGSTYSVGDGHLTVSGNTWSLDVTHQTLSETTYNVVASATDVAGNTATDTQAIIIDRTAPSTGTGATDLNVTAITTDSGTSGDFRTNDNTLVISGTFNAADTATLTVAFNGSTYSVGDGHLTVSGNTWSLDVTHQTLSETTYNVVASATDIAGNTATDTQAIIIDRTAPSTGTGATDLNVTAITTDSGTSGDFRTNDNTLVISGTFNAADTAALSVAFNGTTYVLGVDPRLTVSGNTWSLDVTHQTLNETTYNVVASATDIAGNTATDTQAIIIDRTAPSTGTGATDLNVTAITTDSGTPGDFRTNDNTLVISGTFNAADTATLTVAFNGTTYSVGDGHLTVSGNTWSLDVTHQTLADATYTVVASATDVAGNTSTDSQDIVVDSSVPTGLSITAIGTDSGTPGDFRTNDNTLVISGTYNAADTDTLSVSFNGTTYVLGTDPRLTVSGNTWSLDVTHQTLTETTYDVVASVVTPLGATASQTQAVIIDRTAPSTGTGATDLNVTAITTDSGTSGDFRTNDNTLVISGTFNAADTATLTVAFNGTTYSVGDGYLSVSGNTWSLDVTHQTLSETTYNVVASATDVAGNTATDTQAIIIDRTAPSTGTGATDLNVTAITTDSGTSGDFRTNDNTLVISGTFNAADTATLTVAFNGSTYSVGDGHLTVSGNTWSLDVTHQTLSETTYNVVASATDAAGNTATDTQAIIIDRTAPSTGTGATDLNVTAITTDSGTSGDFRTNDNTLVISGTFNAADTATLTVAFNGSTYTVGDGYLSVSGNTWSLDVTHQTLSETTYNVVASATDIAGNTATDTQAIIIDRTAPSTGTGATDLNVTAIGTDSGVNGDFVTNDNTLVISGSFNPDDTTAFSVTFNGVTYVLGSSPELTVSGNTWSLDVTASPLNDGPYNVVASATDIAGNTATDTQAIIIDRTAPSTGTGATDLNVTAIGTDSGVNGDFVTNDNTLVISGSFNPDDTTAFSVTFNGVTYVLGSSPELTVSGNTWSLDVTASSLNDGPYDVVASATDLAGNVATASKTIVVDTVAPASGGNRPTDLNVTAIGSDSGVNGDFVTNDNTLVISGSFNPDDTTAFSVTFNGVTYVLGSSPELTVSGNTWSLDVTASPLNDGPYDVVASATDLAGNVATASKTIVVDTVAPASGGNRPTDLNVTAIGTDSGVNGDFVTNDNTLVISGSFNPDDTTAFSVTFNGVTYVLGSSPELTVSGNTWSLDVTASPLNDGPYDVVASATDLAGNVATASKTIVVDTVAPTPTVDAYTGTDQTPVLTGTVDLGDGDSFTVTVNGRTYTLGDGLLTVNNGRWSLQIPDSDRLPEGRLDVTATLVDSLGNVASDQSAREIQIIIPPPVVPSVPPAAQAAPAAPIRLPAAQPDWKPSSFAPDSPAYEAPGFGARDAYVWEYPLTERGFSVTVIRGEVPNLLVYRGVPDQYIRTDAPFQFVIPSDAFVHSRSDAQVILNATLLNGDPLPSWLRFNRVNGSFEGVPPAGMNGEVRIKVMARDTTGMQAEAVFRILVGAPQASVGGAREGLSARFGRLDYLAIAPVEPELSVR